MPGAMSSQRAQYTAALERPAPISLGDVALASALAQAARSVKHVVDLGAGRYGVAATYGPGQRITGIVLRRSAQPEGSEGSAAVARLVEAHIIVSTAAVAPKTQPPQRKSPNAGTRGRSVAPGTPVLLRIAEEARGALAAILLRLRPGERWDINIVIDDLRDADAQTSSGAQ